MCQYRWHLWFHCRKVVSFDELTYRSRRWQIRNKWQCSLSAKSGSHCCSITSSAATSNPVGTVTPSAVSVFALTTGTPWSAPEQADRPAVRRGGARSPSCLPGLNEYQLELVRQQAESRHELSSVVIKLGPHFVSQLQPASPDEALDWNPPSRQVSALRSSPL